MEDKLSKSGKFGFVGDRSLRMLLARARELEVDGGELRRAGGVGPGGGGG